MIDLVDHHRREQFIEGQREILKRIVDPNVDRHTILESIVALAESHVEDMTASILLLDESGTRLYHGASSRLPQRYVTAINGARIGPKTGSCGTAAFLKRRVIVEDIANDPLWADYRDLALSHGLKACWSEPILNASKAVIGTLAYYYATPKQPGKWELMTIVDIAQLAGIAIAHKDSIDAMRRLQGRFEESQEIARIGSWELDLTKNLLWWSKEVYRIFAVESEDMKPTYEGFLERVHPEDREMVNEAYSRAVDERSLYDVTHRLLMKDGTVCFVRERGRTYYDDEDRPLRSIGTVQDISEQRSAEERLSWMSYYDDLTELPNRRMFLDRLQMAIELSRRTGHSLAVLYFDLNRFKIINDSLGHGVGDLVLRAVADRVDQVLRAADTVARFGGDEFAILLPESGASNALRVAEKIAREVERPVSLDEQDLVLSISAGAVIFPDDGDDAQTLLKHADIAMYRAKTSGQHLCLFSGEMSTRLKDRMLLEHELSLAQDRAQFSLHFQCKYYLEDLIAAYESADHASGGAVRALHMDGCEALIRWYHPDRGWISPSIFIPLAEEIGLIQRITQWVVEAAARQALKWEAEGIRPERISLNVSAIQLIHQGLAEDILSWVRGVGADPTWFEVEITETAAMHNSETATEIMNELAAAGMSIAIDDFGTGYSSLAYLKRIPATVIKIDQSFIRDLPESAEDMAIVRSTIAMAHALDKCVVAEGVETLEQLRFLEKEGCDVAQGYLLNRPMDEAEFTGLLRLLHKTAD
ncbi:MAG: EAL domain-containing protein [Gammaproteobacteria bacterium]|nr:EAL domain-containing protein [Gammaproteobacteria bacterium]